MKPEICLQDLKAYNEGRLYFKWYGLEFGTIEDIYNDFKKQVKKDLKYEPEEIMIADYSDFPNMGEYPDQDKLNDVWEYMREHDDQLEAIRAFIDNGNNINDFEDAYCGEYDSMEDYAYELVQDCYDLNAMGNLANYIDYEKFGRDLEHGGDYFYVDGYVFKNI